MGSARRNNYTAYDRARWRKVSAERYIENYERVAAIKTASLCADCGWGAWDPAFHHSAMDFDHRPGARKSLNVSRMMTYSWERIEAEIAKCDIVCARCHRLRTHARHVEGIQVHKGRPRLEDRVPPPPTLFDEAGWDHAG